MRQGRTGVSYKGESKTGRGGRGRGRGAVSKASESQRGGELGLRLAICRVQGYEAQDEGRATESVVVRGCGTRQGAAALVTRGAAEMVAGRREKREDGEKKETVKRKEEEGEEEKREMVALLVSQQFEGLEAGEGRSRSKSRSGRRRRSSKKQKQRRLSPATRSPFGGKFSASAVPCLTDQIRKRLWTGKGGRRDRMVQIGRAHV